jgi:hypothetical protein
MQPQLLENKLRNAKNSISEATGDNIIEMCDKYLILLNKSRFELYKLRGEFEIVLSNAPYLEHRGANGVRKQVREECAMIMSEIRVTSILRNRLIASSSYEVTKTLNEQNYQGHDNWEFVNEKYKFDRCADSNQLTTREAVNIAVQLRCEEFGLKKAA